MTEEGFEHLKVSADLDGRVLRVEFDHGKANEMGSAQLDELSRLIDVLESPSAPVCLISTSRRRSRKGTPIFVAGANVTERHGWSDEQVMKHVRWQRDVLSRLRAAPVFHVCAVGGVALGWGTEFLLTADYRIGAPGARFALPETGLGILPGAGGTSELQAQIGAAHALRLGMTGEQIGLDEALRIGLIQEHADDLDAALERAMELARRAATRSPTANAAFKRALLACAGEPWPERMEREARAYEHTVRSGDAAIGRAHFQDVREGRTPPWSPRALGDV